MKTLTNLVCLLFLVLAMTACPGCKDEITPIVDTTLEYQTVIDAKYKALGWTNGPDNGGKAQQTAGKKGWVQYYGGKDRAIYYFNNTAYAVLNYEMKKYDQLGQDNYALVSSDYVSLKSNAGYIGIKNFRTTVTEQLLPTRVVEHFWLTARFIKNMLP